MRLIDADALLSGFDVRKVTEYDESGCAVDYKAVSVEAIENAPAIDAEPVRHGRWEKANFSGFLVCSCCNDVFINSDWLHDGKWSYCPNCGAKMDLEV